MRDFLQIFIISILVLIFNVLFLFSINLLDHFVLNVTLWVLELGTGLFLLAQQKKNFGIGMTMGSILTGIGIIILIIQLQSVH